MTACASVSVPVPVPVSVSGLLMGRQEFFEEAKNVAPADFTANLPELTLVLQQGTDLTLAVSRGVVDPADDVRGDRLECRCRRR
jgi:hypothetical protein